MHQVVQFCNDLAVAVFLLTKSYFDSWFLCQSLLYLPHCLKILFRLQHFFVILWKLLLLLVLIAVLEPSYLVTVCFAAKSILQPLTKPGAQHYWYTVRLTRPAFEVLFLLLGCLECKVFLFLSSYLWIEQLIPVERLPENVSSLLCTTSHLWPLDIGLQHTHTLEHCNTWCLSIETKGETCYFRC